MWLWFTYYAILLWIIIRVLRVVLLCLLPELFKVIYHCVAKAITKWDDKV